MIYAYTSSMGQVKLPETRKEKITRLINDMTKTERNTHTQVVFSNEPVDCCGNKVCKEKPLNAAYVVPYGALKKSDNIY